MRIVKLVIDLSTWSFIPLPRFFNSRRTPPLLDPSLVLSPEQSAETVHGVCSFWKIYRINVDPPKDGGDLRDFYHKWTNSILQQMETIFWKITDVWFRISNSDQCVSTSYCYCTTTHELCFGLSEWTTLIVYKWLLKLIHSFYPFPPDHTDWFLIYKRIQRYSVLGIGDKEWYNVIGDSITIVGFDVIQTRMSVFVPCGCPTCLYCRVFVDSTVCVYKHWPPRHPRDPSSQWICIPLLCSHVTFDRGMLPLRSLLQVRLNFTYVGDVTDLIFKHLY
jgi:hypothetical protein